MGDVRQGRWTTKVEGDFVVFLIGARLQPTHPLRSLRDLGGFTRSMPQMLKYLMEHPEKGLLGYQMSGISLMNVQYWRSFEHLERFAKDESDPHLATWRSYWKRLGKADFAEWHALLNARGWLAPHWPEEWGGTGWSPLRKHLFMEELYNADGLDYSWQGLHMVAPVLIDRTGCGLSTPIAPFNA
jgi:hypothetical protein